MALVVALLITSWRWQQWVRCWGVDGIVGGDIVLTLVASGAAVRVQVVATGEAVWWRAELRGNTATARAVSQTTAVSVRCPPERRRRSGRAE